MRLIIKPSVDIFDTIAVDINDIRKMYLTEYGLEIEMNDFETNIRVIKIDALICSEYEITIEE